LEAGCSVVLASELAMMDLYAVSAWMMGWVCIIRFMGLSVSIGLVEVD
jgi:hypothetical protein